MSSKQAGTGGRPSVSVDEALEHGGQLCRAAGQNFDRLGFLASGDWERARADVLEELRAALTEIPSAANFFNGWAQHYRDEADRVVEWVARCAEDSTTFQVYKNPEPYRAIARACDRLERLLAPREGRTEP